jgi:hypothetical protein
MPGTPRIALAAALAGLVMVLGACGDDDETTTTTSTTTTGPTGATGATGAGESADCEKKIAYIDPASGEFEGLAPDCREGTKLAVEKAGSLDQAAKAASCDLELNLKDEGNRHISPDAKTPDYKTDPPTSGDHDAVPAADGAYLEAPPAINYVHSMEHGRVIIHYDPSLPRKDQLAIKGLFEDDPKGLLMFPNSDMPYAVATTAWTNLMGCDEYSPEVLGAIQAFRDQFRGKGPEAIPL